MFYCENCGAALTIKGKFCEKCGHPLKMVPANLVDTKQADNRASYNGTTDNNMVSLKGNNSNNISIVNGNNDTDVSDVENLTVGYNTVQASAEAIKSKKSFGKVMIASVIGLLAVVIIVILIIVLNKGGADSVLYIKNGKLYTYVLSEKKSYEEAGNMFKSSLNQYEKAPTVCTYLRTDEKNEQLIYPQKLTSEKGNSTYQLYRKEILSEENVEKIDSSVKNWYYVDSDLSHIFYLDDSDRLFQYDMSKGEKTKIDSYVTDFIASDDGNYIVYLTSEGMAYIKNHKKEMVKLSSDVTRIIKVYNTGEVYYIEKDIMSDDNEQQLCFYDGQKSKKVSGINKNCIWRTTEAADVPVIVFAGESDGTKNTVWYIANREHKQSVDVKNVQSAYLNKSGNKAMFYTDVKSNIGDLYSVDISGSEELQAKSYDTEVADMGFNMMFIDNDFVYYKDYSDNSADLIISRKTIDYNVYPASLVQVYNESDKKFYYMIDMIKSSGKYLAGTLKVYDGKKTKKIADDVFAYYDIMTDGTVVYLADYNTSSETGDLCLYKNDKSLKLVENVDGFVSGSYGEKSVTYALEAQKYIKSYKEIISQASNELDEVPKDYDWN